MNAVISTRPNQPSSRKIDDHGNRNTASMSKTTNRIAVLRRERQRAIEAIWQELPEAELRAFNALGEALVARIERFAAGEERSLRAPSAEME